MSAPIDPLTQVAIEATVKAAISEGCKTIPKAAVATWNGMKRLIGKWSGGKDQKKVEEAIEDVVEKPERESRQEGLAGALANLEAAPEEEMISLAKELKKLLDDDPAAAEKTGHVTQIVENVTRSTVVQNVGDGDVTAINAGRDVSQKKTTE